MKQTDDPTEERSICIGCGFCCDGTLHPFSELAPDDDKIVVDEGLGLLVVRGKKAFAQPCPKFDCGRCSIYARRPEVCRTYRCQLRIDVDEGRMAVAEAYRHIGAVKELLAKAGGEESEALTSERRKALWQELKAGLADDGPDRGERQRRLLDLGRLEYLLESHFRPKRETK
jgi:Fe-S-cluster containining protein